jgi:hypothetical protein
LALTAPILTAGQFSFSVTGPEGATVIIETSTDLGNWQPAGTNFINGGSAAFTFAAQNQGSQFFRALQSL